MENLKITVVSDGSTQNVKFTLDINKLKKIAVHPKTFENPKNGTENYSESYMRKNTGIRIVNNNGNYEIWQVGNHDSFFSTHKITDLKSNEIELPYILGNQIKNTFNV